MLQNLAKQFEGKSGQTPMDANGRGVMAQPSMYIDVIINGQKQIYDVQTAMQLRNALNSALQPMDQAIAAQEQNQEAGETQPPNGQSTPDDQSPPTDETDEPAADGDSPPDA